MNAEEAFEWYEKSNQKEAIFAKIMEAAQSGMVSTTVYSSTMSSSLRHDLEILGYKVVRDALSTSIIWDPAIVAQGVAQDKLRKFREQRPRRQIGTCQEK